MKLQEICFWDDTVIIVDEDGNKIRIDIDFDKLTIDTNNKGKEFAKQLLCKLVDEAEEI